MNIHLADNGTTRGPFSEEQVQTMIANGSVTRTTLAWREGEKDWRPLSELGFESSPLVPPPPPLPPLLPERKSSLGMVSLVFGIVSVLGWFVVFAVAGVAHNGGWATESFNTILGLCMFLGLFLNLVAGILGFVGTVTSTRKAVPLTAALLNVAMIVCVIALVLVGLKMKG